MSRASGTTCLCHVDSRVPRGPSRKKLRSRSAGKRGHNSILCPKVEFMIPTWTPCAPCVKRAQTRTLGEASCEAPGSPEASLGRKQLTT
jgi:hypothetical protein